MDRHQHQQTTSTPKVGMTLAFTAQAEPTLAAIPATVVAVWPPFYSGARLVTLEYATPVQVGHAWITQIEAFVNELYAPAPVRAGPLVQAEAHERETFVRRVTTHTHTLRQGVAQTITALRSSHHRRWWGHLVAVNGAVEPSRHTGRAAEHRRCHMNVP
jgi:ribosomal protein L3